MKKSTHLEALAAAIYEHKKETHPNVPTFAVPRSTYSDAKANDLTKCILDFINLQKDATAWRVSNAPVYDARFGGFRAGNVLKGVADVTAIWRGVTWQIEIKIGRDKMSDHQVKFAERIGASGGRYVVAASFEVFVADWLKGGTIVWPSGKIAHAWNETLKTASNEPVKIRLQKTATTIKTQIQGELAL
jgi:hypothetical protein